MADAKTRGAPRLREAERRQIELRACDLDSLLPEGHRARLVWAAVCRLDLRDFYDGIAAREHTAGQPATDPKILLALWVFATSEAIGSARHLERLCERDHAYLWICGGVTVNRTMLAAFRVEHGAALDALLTQLLAVLMNQGLLELRRVAHDGVRVRADAGASSFRRRSTLEQHLAEAKAQVEQLRRELDDEPAATTSRERNARERAAREQQEQLERALAQMPIVEAAKQRQRSKAGAVAQNDASSEDATDVSITTTVPDDALPTETGRPRKRKISEARVSTTDPEARVMKMGDGGWRPAYNIQLAADTASRFVVGVDVSNVGSDGGQLVPMLDQLERRTARVPQDYLADGGYTKLTDIDALEARGSQLFAPVPTSRCEGVDPHARKRDDTDFTARWRQRMATEQAKKIYVERGATIETVNADLRAWRGLQRLPVRGLAKVRAVALLHALTYNLLRLPRALLML